MSEAFICGMVSGAVLIALAPLLVRAIESAIDLALDVAERF